MRALRTARRSITRIVVLAAVSAVLAVTGVAVAVGSTSDTAESDAPKTPPTLAAPDEDPTVLELLDLPDDTERIPVSGGPGDEIAGWIDARVFSGPDTPAIPDGLPGYPLTDEAGTELLGYLVPGRGPVPVREAETEPLRGELEACAAAYNARLALVESGAASAGELRDSEAALVEVCGPGIARGEWETAAP